MTPWTNGMDTAGSGHFPIGVNCAGNNCANEDFYTDNDNHNHGVDISSVTSSGISNNHLHTVNPPLISSGTGNTNHRHNIDLPNQQSSIDNNEPPWHGLVKIIRIK